MNRFISGSIMNKPAAVVLALLLAGAAGRYGYYYFNIKDISSRSSAADSKRVFASSVESISLIPTAAEGSSGMEERSNLRLPGPLRGSLIRRSQRPM